MIDLAALVLSCAPLVAQDTARALIQVESSGNPFAVGVVGGALVRQPANLPEAVATVAALQAAGWNYSVGLGQINKRNFQHYGLSPATAFEPCANLFAMQGILRECFLRASRRAAKQTALRDAFSCYYSGNFQTGHLHGYVGKVLAAWSSQTASARNANAAGQVPSRLRQTQANLPPPQPRSPAMNPVDRTSTHSNTLSLASRTAVAVLFLATALAATTPAMAQALDPVVRGATIARDTVIAITLLLMTVGVGIAGYKIMFAGANFRDVSNLIFGGALAGAAAAIAAVFMG